MTDRPSVPSARRSRCRARSGSRAGRWAPTAILALTVSSLAGCGLLGLNGAPATTVAPTPSPGPTWSIYLPGRAVPAAAAPAYRPLPSSPSLDLPAPPDAVRATTASPAVTCNRNLREGNLNGLTVVAGAGSATLSWYAAGETALLTYRLAAVSQDHTHGQQKPVTWTDVAPGARCATQSSTVTGLTRGGTYTFWLHAVTTKAGGGTRDMMVARSIGVTVS